MTNTKFRKRALLSSVAMLLVALVALGSATFAWFVANPTVKADGLQMQVVAAPGLKIASESDKVKTGSYTFGSTAKLAEQDFDLQPASPNLGATVAALDSIGFAEIQASVDDQYGRDTDKNFASVTPMTVTSYASDTFGTTTGGSKVYYEDLYFQKSGTGSEAVTIQSVAVNMSQVNNDIAKGLKVMLVARKPGTTASYQLLGVWKATGGDDTHYWAGATDSSAISADAYSYTTNGGTVKNLSISVDNTAAGSGAVIRAYIYLDGENQYTTSSRATSLTQLLTKLDIRVSTANDTISFT